MCSSELHTAAMAPTWIRERHVLSLYRVRLSFKQATQSIFSIHSESINIWTHGLELLLAMWFYCHLNTYYPLTSQFHQLARNFVFVAEFFKCFASAFAHTYCCMSFRMKQMCWQVFIYICLNIRLH